jgi:putative NADH-flavin reductase
MLTVAVLGSTGATGRHVVASALARGHQVVALVRTLGALEPAPRLREVVWANLDDESTLTEAFRGADAVISALGGASKGPTTVCTNGMRTAIAAMKQADLARLIVVSAHGVGDTHDTSLYSMAVWAGVGDKMRDKESMESLVVTSGLEWTIVRPPALKDNAERGRYKASVDVPIRLWSSVGRADLAGFLVREAEEPQFVHSFPRIVG